MSDASHRYKVIDIVELAKLSTAADSLRVLRLAKCCDVCSLRFARVDDHERQLFTVPAQVCRTSPSIVSSHPSHSKCVF